MVGRRGQGGRGAAVVARVDGGERAGGRGARVVQAGLAEGADGPGVVVVVVVGGQSSFPAVQPREARAVEQVRPAHLSPGQARCQTKAGLA